MKSLDIPLDHTTIKRVTHYTTRVIVELNERATIIIELYGENCSIPISTIGKVLEKDEYDKWGEDDSYIESIVSAEIDKLRTPVLEEIPLEEFEILAEESVVAGEPVKPVRKTRAKKTA